MKICSYRLSCDPFIKTTLWCLLYYCLLHSSTKTTTIEIVINNPQPSYAQCCIIMCYIIHYYIILNCNTNAIDAIKNYEYSPRWLDLRCKNIKR